VIKVNRKVLLIVLTLFVVLLTTPLVATAQAITVQEVTGKLGGADFLLRIPSNWNKKLIVFCHGFSHLEPTPAYLVTAANQMAAAVSNGFAIALSTYGAGGYCVKEGIIRTHQMTEYIMDNYDVTGKVYLLGISMGGNIVLELGAKYPDLYDGVLDICGSKNLMTQYTDKMYFAGISDDTALQTVVFNKYGVIIPLAGIPGFRDFSFTSGTDIWLACGGNTPEEKPKAYERISPTFSAVDITIPTITVHGDNDPLVPYSSALELMNAVDAAGYSDMYRLYRVAGGGHADSKLMIPALTVYWPRLTAWVETGVPALPSVP
jgi:pimeloyl-ACP methyl ester carboxylesterase